MTWDRFITRLRDTAYVVTCRVPEQPVRKGTSHVSGRSIRSGSWLPNLAPVRLGHCTPRSRTATSGHHRHVRQIFASTACSCSHTFHLTHSRMMPTAVADHSSSSSSTQRMGDSGTSAYTTSSGTTLANGGSSYVSRVGTYDGRRGSDASEEQSFPDQVCHHDRTRG